MNVLSIITSNDGLRSLFAQVFISTVLSIYEFILFYTIVVPTVNQQASTSINNAINKLKSSLSIPIELQSYIVQDILLQNTDIQDINQHINAFFFTLKERELQKINKINTYTKITGALIIGICLIIMFSLYIILVYHRHKHIGMCTWFTIIVSLILVGAFQYSFYLYGNKYNYIGSKGNQELIAFLYDNIINNLAKK
jgi:hypothetical protein